MGKDHIVCTEYRYESFLAKKEKRKVPQFGDFPLWIDADLET